MTVTIALPTLVAIRAAHHPTFDRVVFEFTGVLPAQHEAKYVPAVIGHPSSEQVPLVGNAFLNVRLEPAVGHDDNGNVTYGPIRRTYPLPNVIQVVGEDLRPGRYHRTPDRTGRLHPGMSQAMT